MCPAKSIIIEEIVDQHFEEAAFLWSQRDAAATASNCTLPDLAFLDERVEAHIDGLRLAGEYGWKLCEAGLDIEDPGTLFAASVIAFESGDKDRIDLVVGASSQSQAAFRAVVSALGWMDYKHFKALIIGLVSAKSQLYRRLGIAACGIRRINPKNYLDEASNSSDLFLKALAFKSAGELKRVDLLPQLQKHFQHEDHTCRLEAAKSALLLGDSAALDTLAAFVLSQSEHTLPAMQTALRVADTATARNWLKEQSKIPEQRRQVLIGAGITGEPTYIPMLIKQMEQAEFARISGHAFSMITGVNLKNLKLDAVKPEGFDAGPNDDPKDDNVAMDQDEDLSWPNVVLVTRWWEQNNAAFIKGTRYLAGSAISQESCIQLLKTADQKTRQAASLEIALSSPNSAFLNVKAPGFTQSRSA